MNQYVAAGPSLAAFLLAAEVAQQCLVTSRKIAPEFFNRITSFPNPGKPSMAAHRINRLQAVF
jgi:hypothetical protein